MARWTIVGINPTRRGDALAEDIRSTHCQLIIADEGGRSLISGLDLTLADDRIIDVREAARNAAESELVDLEESHPDDLLLLLFTSGTTGTPKAVRCTTGRLAGIAETAAPAYGYQRSDVCYCPMPLFHGNALMALVAPGLLVGATIALRPRFSAGSFLDDVRTFGATTFTYVGKAIAYILATPEADSDLDNTLERGFGTEASSGDRARFIERFGCRLVEGYGSSEGGVNIIATPDTPPGALGPALGGADIAVVDPVTGREMAPAVFDEAGVLVNGNEAIGEIVNRDGPGKFEGYYANEEAQASRTKNGWYWTGDLAYRDTDGYFWFAGRGGDWLRVDSENLAATPIESVLSRYPAFAGVAVYAVPDVETSAGDLVMLAAELRASTFDPDDFARWLDAQEDLGTKWAPSYVRLCEKIDETATGKITKVRLQAERWHSSDPVYVRASRDNRYELLTPAMASSLDDRLAKR
jgi:fatty-acyl-CoA synthase